MTSTSRCGCDEGGSTTDEGGVTSGGNDHEGLTTLHTGGSVASVTHVLVDSEGLAGDRGLIDLEEGIFGDNATIGWNNSTLELVRDCDGKNGIGRLTSSIWRI